MRNLWVKISLGAAGIFVVGMLGVTLAGQAKAAASEAIHDMVGQAPAALAGAIAGHHTQSLASLQSIGQDAGNRFVSIPFRVDGQDLGVIQRGSLRRARANALPALQLDVELTADQAADVLADCILIPLGDRHSDFHAGFRCASDDDRDLVTFGRVRFEPTRNSVPVMLTSDQAADLRHGDPFEANADLGGQVSVDARGQHGEVVRIRAGDNGANIQINDEFGRDLFRLIADSAGAALHVRDEKGRKVVSLMAGDGGLSLNIDATGH